MNFVKKLVELWIRIQLGYSWLAVYMTITVGVSLLNIALMDKHVYQNLQELIVLGVWGQSKKNKIVSPMNSLWDPHI